MIMTSQRLFISLKRHMAEYRPQLEKAIAAIQILEVADPDTEEFSQALADLQVAATVLEPYSEGMTASIERFTDDRPD